jgi:hypothetical protein
MTGPAESCLLGITGPAESFIIGKTGTSTSSPWNDWTSFIILLLKDWTS